VTPALTRRGLLHSGVGGFLAGAVSVSADAAEPITVVAEALPFDERDAMNTRAGALSYRGGGALKSPDGRFGGWSDLALLPDDRIVLIGDRGFWLDARFERDANAAPRALVEARIGSFRGPDGRVLRGLQDSDAEGLARLSDGSLVVSFERHHRLLRYAAGTTPFETVPRALLRPPGIENAPRNGGMEAIAALTDDRLVVFAEELHDERGDLAAWIETPHGWERFAWPFEGFRPTGATLAPDGALLVLERRFATLALTARIVRVDPTTLRAGIRAAPVELARWGAPLLVDNFEGIAATRGERGETLVYLIADDNYRPLFQRTLLLCFAIEG
jgi:hypothetical protein